MRTRFEAFRLHDLLLFDGRIVWVLIIVIITIALVLCFLLLWVLTYDYEEEQTFKKYGV